MVSSNDIRYIHFHGEYQDRKAKLRDTTTWSSGVHARYDDAAFNFKIIRLTQHSAPRMIYSYSSQISSILGSKKISSVTEEQHDSGDAWVRVSCHLPSDVSHRTSTEQHLVIEIRDAGQYLKMTSSPTWTVSAPRRTTVLDFITRVNYHMVLGNFDFDLDTGTVSFKTTALTAGAADISELASLYLQLHVEYYRKTYHSLLEKLNQGQLEADSAFQQTTEGGADELSRVARLIGAILA